MEGAVLTGPEGLAAAASEDVLLSNLPCIGCGYDLKSMRVSAKCPECGRACEESLGSLYAADAGEVSGMVAGLRMMVWAAVAVPLVSAGLLFIDIRRDTQGPEFALLGMAGCGIVGPVLAWTGLRRVTGVVRPSAGAAGGRKTPILERAELARVAGLVYVVLSGMSAVFIAALTSMNRHGPPSGHWWMWVAGTLGVFTTLSWTMRNGLVSLRGARIAGFSNRPGMRRIFLAMAWISALGAAFAVFYGLVGVAASMFGEQIFDYRPGQSRTLISAAIMGLQVVTGVVYVGAIGWMLLWPIMLGLLARGLRKMGEEVRAGGGVIVGRAGSTAGVAGDERLGPRVSDEKRRRALHEAVGSIDDPIFVRPPQGEFEKQEPMG